MTSLSAISASCCWAMVEQCCGKFVIMMMWIDCECRWSDKLGKIRSDNLVRQFFRRQELVSCCRRVTACRRLAVELRDPTVHSTVSLTVLCKYLLQSRACSQHLSALYCIAVHTDQSRTEMVAELPIVSPPFFLLPLSHRRVASIYFLSLTKCHAFCKAPATGIFTRPKC